jgi:hypothetical protein
MLKMIGSPEVDDRQGKKDATEEENSKLTLLEPRA